MQPEGKQKSGLQRKRTLKLSLSTASEESRCTRHYDEDMLALEDIKDEDKVEADQDDDEEQQEHIEDTNGEPFVYQWDDVTNKGKRQKPGGRWHLCHWQEKNRTTGFMTCCWKTNGGVDKWHSDMTIMEYESIEPPTPMKKPAAAAMKKPAAAMKKPAAANKLDPTTRKREYSKIYHDTLMKAIANGDNQAAGKVKARDAAKKHCQNLANSL